MALKVRAAKSGTQILLWTGRYATAPSPTLSSAHVGPRHAGSHVQIPARVQTPPRWQSKSEAHTAAVRGIDDGASASSSSSSRSPDAVAVLHGSTASKGSIAAKEESMRRQSVLGICVTTGASTARLCDSCVHSLDYCQFCFLALPMQ